MTTTDRILYLDRRREPVDWDAVANLVKAGIHPDQLEDAYHASGRLAEAGAFPITVAAQYVAQTLAWVLNPYGPKGETTAEAEDPKPASSEPAVEPCTTVDLDQPEPTTPPTTIATPMREHVQHIGFRTISHGYWRTDI